LEQKDTGSWINQNKFVVILIVMVLIWGSLLWYFITYAQAINVDPCSSCAKQMGDKVFCTTGDTVVLEKTFYENGSIVTKYPDTNYRSFLVNFTQ